ncbi:MAG: 3-methyl-2-oxobutanoate dehydrogenase subunit VorB [Armatimonadetes bacterium]|nr:3-methyl-2-oxobutanoate dehydrogenase subunit VorB [Armatimonadota bacterium]
MTTCSRDRRVLIKGNEACAEGAIAGGCRYFFGYPITPQNQIPEYMAKHLPEVGGVYVQAESEVAAINMVIGAAAAGAIPMTSSSSPGISLMQEGLSYILGCELPCVVVNMVRGGPGLGNVLPAQSDYWLATRGAGHGDGRCLTFAPYNLQELHDWTADAFEVAARYRLPVMILADAVLAQMMEPVRLRPRGKVLPLDREWAVGGGLRGRQRRVINSLWVRPEVMEAVNLRMASRFQQAEREMIRFELIGDPEPDVLLCAYGTMARVCETAAEWVRDKGVRAAVFRPISLVPFPYEQLRQASERSGRVLVVELSLGQFVEDVRLAIANTRPVHFLGRAGGALIGPEDLADHVMQLLSAGDDTA